MHLAMKGCGCGHPRPQVLGGFDSVAFQWYRCDTGDGLDHRSQGCHLHFTATCDLGTPRQDESHLRANEVLRHTNRVQSSHESHLRHTSGL
jgi:hypothetical protein